MLLSSGGQRCLTHLLTKVKPAAGSDRWKSSISASSTKGEPHQSLEELEIGLKTSVPGPTSTKMKEELLSMQQMGTVTLVSDMRNSQGNYLKDVDGNTYLDCFMQIASIPLGYNNPRIINALLHPDNLHLLANRPAYAWFPNEEWHEKVRSTFLSVAPNPSLDQIYPMMCGSCSNENAIKLVFQRYMHKRRGGRTEFTKEEMDSTMEGEAPGAPKLSLLAFKGGFHGRTVGLLSCSNSRPLHGVDIPVLPWPKADFPRYRYPLESFERENKAEDDRCLATVEEKIQEQAKKGVPVAGIIVEPIQAEGGDNHGSAYFFQVR